MKGLTNFEIQKYYQKEPRFNGIYSRDNIPKIKDGAYVINLYEYSDIGTHWVAFYVSNNDATYFDTFGVLISFVNILRKREEHLLIVLYP